MKLEYICFNISSKCNMNCPYCYRVGSDTNGGYVELEKAKVYIDFLIQHGCKTISLTGGEPLLNPFWRDILEYCSHQGLYSILSTNGLLLDVSDSALNKLDVLALSLDGSTDIINAHTRSKNQYNKVIDIIKQCAEMPHHFTLKINTVVTRYNLFDVSDILKIVDYPSVIWKIFKLRSKGVHYHFPPEMIPTDEEFEKTKSDISSLSTKCSVFYLGGESNNTKSTVKPDYFILDYNGDLYLGSEKENRFLFNIESEGNNEIVDYQSINNQYQEELKNDLKGH